VITTSPISETTSSPRMSIMRLLLSSGAEGKRIHSQADLGAAGLADPFPVEHRGEPERGRACPRSAHKTDIVACPRWTRSDATIHACTALPRRRLVPCYQQHAENTRKGKLEAGGPVEAQVVVRVRTTVRHEMTVAQARRSPSLYFFAQRASACWSAAIA